jgi:hypothetical protein
MRRAVRSRAAGFLAVLAFAIAAIALPRAQAPAPVTYKKLTLPTIA